MLGAKALSYHVRVPQRCVLTGICGILRKKKESFYYLFLDVSVSDSESLCLSCDD
jgi:hypothetical protein